MSTIAIKDAKDFLYEVQKKKDKQDARLVGVKSDILEARKNVLDLKILVGVDVSGSISERQFRQFMRQIDAIRGLSMVKVIEIDTKIVAMYDYFRINPASVCRLMGGGGTEFREFFQKAKEIKPDAILFMTDGEVFDKVSDPGIPTGWILTAGGRKPYGFGKVVLELPQSLG